MISEISEIIRDDSPSRKMHVRDLLNVSQTSSPQIVGGQVTGWTDALTLGATVLAENTAAPESTFESQENTWAVKRIANSMRISKRWFKTNGLQWVIDYVLAKLPDATYTVEDFELLFGDGSGNHVSGLAKAAQVFDLSPNTYVATSFSSVATWNGGTQALVTFAAAHGMRNGDSLTIANATETTYNATHTAVQIVNATSVIIDVAYVAEADTSAWTGTSTNIFYHTIDNAQEYDVLAVQESLLEVDEFSVSGHVVNPQQKVQMGLLKATDDNYLNIQRDAAGRVVGVNGKPIVSTSAMPAGRFISGDFSRNGAELKEFTPFNLQFVEDVTTAKANEIVIVVEEEIIFPVYNPYAFGYGKFADAKTELETPAS
jgi:HK97 family phage major capsid protein